MFGLMKAKTCSLADELKHHRRLHYCGTCKTMGSLYGQKTRALLNHDTVFLAEVLTAISADNESLRGWHRAYQSFNCLTLPKTVAAMPVALQLAATATVVLTEFKLADHISDSKSAIWKSARRFFSKSFRQAEAKLKEWQFPLADLQSILESQQARETAALATNTTIYELLHDLAEPTATATAMFFQHGARLVGREEFAEAIYEIGYAFGELAYLLDAFEDYEKDFRKGEFNALRVAYRLADTQLPAESRRDILQRLRRLGIKIQSGLLDLPMPEAMAALYATRLQTNLTNRLGGLPLLPIQHTHTQVCASRLSIKERWRNAVQLGCEMVTRYRDAHTASLTAKLSTPFIFASVLPVAFFAPQQANTANSYRECLSLSFNLMFLGSVVASTAAMANLFFLRRTDRTAAQADSRPLPDGKDRHPGNHHHPRHPNNPPVNNAAMLAAVVPLAANVFLAAIAKLFGWLAASSSEATTANAQIPEDISNAAKGLRGRRRRQGGGNQNSGCSFCCCDADCCDCCDCCDGCDCCSDCSCCSDCNCCDSCDCGDCCSCDC